MDKIRASTWAEVQGCLYADSWKEYALGSLMSRRIIHSTRGSRSIATWGGA